MSEDTCLDNLKLVGLTDGSFCLEWEDVFGLGGELCPVGWGHTASVKDALDKIKSLEDQLSEGWFSGDFFDIQENIEWGLASIAAINSGAELSTGGFFVWKTEEDASSACEAAMRAITEHRETLNLKPWMREARLNGWSAPDGWKP